MQSVEETASRLDGVADVSAGWRTNAMTIVTKPGATLDRARIDEAFKKTSFKVKSFEQVNK